MESERLYRVVFYSGCGWNLLASIPTFFLVSLLPSLIEIADPRYPIFIYFNLMTVALFGCIQFTVARNLRVSRGFVKILAWSKILTFSIFVGSLFLLDMPGNLITFLAPGMVIDLLFGLLFWRYLTFSKRQQAAHLFAEQSLETPPSKDNQR
jgi:hypothetical protein